MNRIAAGLLLSAVTFAAAVYTFAPRPLPVYPPTEVSVTRLVLLGLAQAGRRLVAVGERGVVVLSDDEGRSWRPAKTPTTATLAAVRFVDARRGFAAGHDAVILATDDAGETWTQVHSAPDEGRPLLALWFDDARRGVAAGAYGAWYETDDGGKTWKPRRALDGDQHINALAGGADGKLFVAGEAGLLARSDDAGRSFTTLASPYKGSFFGVLRLADGGVIVFGLRGNVFRSDDDGASWTRSSPAGAEATLLGGALRPDGGVLIVGHEGTMVESADGRNFSARKTAAGKSLAAALPLPGGASVLAGEAGIVRTDTGG